MKKYIVLIAVISVMVSCKPTTDFQTYYDNHKAEAKFSIGVSGTLARMFIPREEKELLGPLLKKSGKFKVLVFDEDNNKATKNLTRFIKSHRYEQLFRISDKKERVDIYFKEDDKETIKELIFRIKSNNEFVVLACKTNLTSEDLANLGESLDISL